jgi:hypothetical protein
VGLSERDLPKTGGWTCNPCQKAVEAANKREEIRSETLEAIVDGHGLRGKEQAENLTNKWSSEALSSAQELDPVLGEVYRQISAGGSLPIKGSRDVIVGRYVKRDGVLHMEAEGSSSQPRSDQYKVCVPEALKTEVLFALHDDALGGGHLGRDKTFAKVYSHFYWPSMYADIQVYVERCTVCARRKGPGRAQIARLNPIPVAEVGDRWVVDLVGPLPESKKGNKYIAVFVDSFSKYVVARPIPKKEAQLVAEIFLFDVICEFGTPRELQSDQGKEFAAGIVQELCKMPGVREHFSTPYRPQTNCPGRKVQPYIRANALNVR